MMPPNMMTTTVICDTASMLVTGVTAALNAANDATHQIQRSFYQLGDIAWDNCDCGMLALSLGRMYISRDFPNDTSKQKVGNCATNHMVQECRLMVVRCFPIEGDNANNALVTPPTPADLQAATRLTIADGVLAWQTLDCTLNSLFNASPARISEYLVQDWDALGPQGGCGGISINFSMGWFRDCGCE